MSSSASATTYLARQQAAQRVQVSSWHTQRPQRHSMASLFSPQHNPSTCTIHGTTFQDFFGQHEAPKYYFRLRVDFVEEKEPHLKIFCGAYFGSRQKTTILLLLLPLPGPPKLNKRSDYMTYLDALGKLLIGMLTRLNVS